jgi:Family of unknown function (DUF6627)
MLKLNNIHKQSLPYSQGLTGKDVAKPAPYAHSKITYTKPRHCHKAVYIKNRKLKLDSPYTRHMPAISSSDFKKVNQVKLRKTLVRSSRQLLLLIFISVSFFIPVGQAAMIDTQQLVDNQQAQQQRDQLQLSVKRAELHSQLQTAGISEQQLQQRIASLNDAEVAHLNAQFEQLPAGSGLIATATFIFLVLLATDILGYTEIFPFVKKTLH